MEKVIIELYVREHPEHGEIGQRIGGVVLETVKRMHPDLITGFVEVRPLNVPETHKDRVQDSLFGTKKELFDAESYDPFRVDL